MLYTTFYLGEFMELYDFAYCGDFNEKIKRLKKIIIDENWGKPKNGKDFPVLHNYIAHYFKKIHQDNQISYAENELVRIMIFMLTLSKTKTQIRLKNGFWLNS